VVSLLTSAQEFQLLQAEDARRAAQKAGLDLEVVFAENNAVLQIHQLYQFIHAPEGQRPTAILVEAVSRHGMERLARNALKAGIAWITQEEADYLDTLRGQSGRVAVASVAVDELEVGRLQAQQIGALLPNGGSVVFIRGPADSATAASRFQGLEAGLRGSRIEMKGLLNADWTPAGGEAAAASWLRLKSTGAEAADLVGAQNDSMALGARQVIRQARPDWGHLRYLGCDGLPNGGRRAVDGGELTATVVKPTTTGPAIELVARSLRGEPAGNVVLRPVSYPPIEDIRPIASRGRA
jgi:ABC-type sugar transport system substrate-binding protein